MKNRISCFIPDSDKESVELTSASLRRSGTVDKIYIMACDDADHIYSDISLIRTVGFFSTDSLKKMAEVADSGYILIYTKTFHLDLGKFALERMMQVCDETAAGMVYSDYFENKNGQLTPHPIILYTIYIY